MASAQQAVATNPRDAQIAEVVRYGGTEAAPLTMDVYKREGAGPHPAVVIVHGGGFISGTSRNGSEAYAADFLAPAGYAVFSINYTQAPGITLAGMAAQVQRSLRFVRANAKRFEVDPDKIALLGGSAGGYLSNLVGLGPFGPAASPADDVDRVSDAVQAVVTLYGISNLATMPDTSFLTKYGLLGPGPVTAESMAMASPVTLVRRGEPPYLLIGGDEDMSVPIAQSLEMLNALAFAGNKAEILVIPNAPHATGSWHRLPGVPDWEREMTEWLNRTLGHAGPVGAGIIARQPMDVRP